MATKPSAQDVIHVLRKRADTDGSSTESGIESEQADTAFLPVSELKAQPGDLIEICRDGYGEWTVCITESHVVVLKQKMRINILFRKIPSKKAKIKFKRLEKVAGDNFVRVNNSDLGMNGISESTRYEFAQRVLSLVGREVPYGESFNMEHYILEWSKGYRKQNQIHPNDEAEEFDTKSKNKELTGKPESYVATDLPYEGATGYATPKKLDKVFVALPPSSKTETHHEYAWSKHTCTGCHFCEPEAETDASESTTWRKKGNTHEVETDASESTTWRKKGNTHEAETDASESTTWRKKGNTHYTSATDNLAPVLRLDRLRQAILCYQTALKVGESSDDRASAAKNLALSLWKWASISGRQNFKTALEHFYKAFEEGKDCKTKSWNSQLSDRYRDCFQEFKEVLNKESRRVKISSLEEVVEFLGITKMRAWCWIEIGQAMFHEGVTALQDGRYIDCLKLMYDCYRPVEEARRLSQGDDSLISEVGVLEHDVFLQTCIAESIKARKTGDSLLEVATKEEEDLNIGLVWDVIDWYRQSVLLSREKDLEMEAIAYSHMGTVYQGVLKLSTYARDYYKMSIQMAISLHPRTFDHEGWYKKATKVLEEYQQNSLLEEQKRNDAEKAEILKELATESKQLSDHSSDDHVTFMTFVYKTFPPKNKSHVMGDVDSDGTKKCLQKAVIHYHPDKVDVEVHGKKWRVLSEEITKCLTRRYERMKGVD